jgi:hypothetical protein
VSCTTAASIRSRSAVHADCTAGPTLAALVEPPDTGACGSAVSPSRNRTDDGRTPSDCAATCVITVYVPVPSSCDPDATMNVPSVHSRALACAAWRLAG